MGVPQQLIAPYKFGKNIAEQSTFDTKLHHLKIYYSICLQFLRLKSVGMKNIREHSRGKCLCTKKPSGVAHDCTIIFVIEHV